jgi:hypothetical protein
MYCGKAFPSLGVHGEKGLIVVGTSTSWMRREGKKKKQEIKKIVLGKECFPRAGPTLLAVQLVITARCN